MASGYKYDSSLMGKTLSFTNPTEGSSIFLKDNGKGSYYGEFSYKTEDEKYNIKVCVNLEKNLKKRPTFHVDISRSNSSDKNYFIKAGTGNVVNSGDVLARLYFVQKSTDANNAEQNGDIINCTHSEITTSAKTIINVGTQITKGDIFWVWFDDCELTSSKAARAFKIYVTDNFHVTRIYNGSEWKQAIVRIYDGEVWKVANPKIYDGQQWKDCPSLSNLPLSILLPD